MSEQQHVEQLLLLAEAVQQVWSWEVHLPCSALPLLILANSGFFVKPVRQRMTNIGQLPQILREENTLLKKEKKGGSSKCCVNIYHNSRKAAVDSLHVAA